MRTSIRDVGRVFGALLLGTAIVSTVAGSAVGQERKETKDLRITVKRWDAQGKKFLNPGEVDARKIENKGRVHFLVPTKQAVGTGQPVKGSEITETDGTVWVVKDGSDNRNGEYQATVEKKTVEKKP